MKLGHQPACDLLDNIDDDRVLVYSVSDCEEIAMLMYHALVSYLECCKSKYMYRYSCTVFILLNAPGALHLPGECCLELEE